MKVVVTIFCAVCELKPPFEGCDAKGCKWREDAFVERVRRGPPVAVVCDETNNSAEDTKFGRLNVDLIAGGI
jgi:hypothetical protein